MQIGGRFRLRRPATKRGDFWKFWFSCFLKSDSHNFTSQISFLKEFAPIWPSGRSMPSVLPPTETKVRKGVKKWKYVKGINIRLFSPCGILRISASDGEASVLLLDKVLPVAVLDAHPGGFAQLEEESLGKLGVARDSTVGHLPVFSIGTL